MNTLHLRPISALTDNYIWLLDDGQHAVVIDPGQAQPVLDVLRDLNLSLQSIVVTHHHADHTGGVAALKQHSGAQVFGPALEQVEALDVKLQGGAELELLGMPCQVIDVPGHTAGHIAFFLPTVAFEHGSQPLLFCGDTLFSAGCGRLFEGTPAQMLQSLDALAVLPANTVVCAAHEYTTSNLRFAHAVEPMNQDIEAAIARTQQLRSAGLPSLPSVLERELRINPFLRSRLACVRQAVAQHTHTQFEDDAQWFGALRAWKDQF